eukprot:COSAG06_NODE_33695_length_485_cov_3.303109_1_plen_56_part_10
MAPQTEEDISRQMQESVEMQVEEFKGHASKATAGALASIAQKHDEEVEAARKLMRQ